MHYRYPNSGKLEVWPLLRAEGEPELRLPTSMICDNAETRVWFALQGLYDRVVLAYFVACGVSRLARYNVTAETLSGDDGKVKYFEGTPIPTSIMLVALMALAAYLGAVRESLWFGKVLIGGFTLHPLVLLFALSGSLMISRIKIPKL
eukprot:gene42075-52157_t